MFSGQTDAPEVRCDRTDRQTDRQTEQTTVILAAHARRGLMKGIQALEGSRIVGCPRMWSLVALGRSPGM